MKKRLVIFMVFSCLLFAGAIQTVEAAQQNIDLTGTEWVMKGKGAINAGKFARGSFSGDAYVSFQDNGYVEITDEEDYTIGGEYGYDDKNKFFLTVDEEEMAEFIADEIGGLSAYADITVTSSKSKATLKATKQGLNLSVNLKFVIVVEVDGSYTQDGKSVKATIRYNMTLKGTHALAAESEQEGSAWIIDGKTICKVKRLKTAGDTTLLIYFGPSSTQGLQSSEFLVYSWEEGQWEEVMDGHFTRKGNKITFIPTTESVEDILDSQLSILVEDNEDIWDAYVIDSISKFTATVKDGVSIKLNGRSAFYSWMEMADGDDWRGTFMVKGVGTPYVEEPQPE